jgi:hypothetical protein
MSFSLIVVVGSAVWLLVAIGLSNLYRVRLKADQYGRRIFLYFLRAGYSCVLDIPAVITGVRKLIAWHLPSP